MIDFDLLKEKLIKLVGIRNGSDPSEWKIVDLVEGVAPNEVTTNITGSDSGLWFNKVHPLITVGNLMSVSEDYEMIHEEVDEVNKVNTINQSFSNWWKGFIEDSIGEMVNDWIEEKDEVGTLRHLIESRKLFNGSGNLSDIQQGVDKFVGLEAKPVMSKNLRFVPRKLSLQLEQNQAITIYLFKSGQKLPVTSEVINYTNEGSVQWFDVSEFTDDWKMKGEGVYWIGYDESALAGNAINGVRDFNYGSSGGINFPCGKYVSITAFKVDADVIGELWDLGNNVYTNGTNYGLNLEYDVVVDYTDLIIEQKGLFARALQLRVGMDILKELQFNPETRVNRNISNVKRNEINYELEGDTQGKNKESVESKYRRALRAISFDKNGLDKIGLPVKRSGIRYKSVGPNVNRRTWY